MTKEEIKSPPRKVRVFLAGASNISPSRAEEWKKFYEWPIPGPDKPIIPIGYGTFDVSLPEMEV